MDLKSLTLILQLHVKKYIYKAYFLYMDKLVSQEAFSCARRRRGGANPRTEIELRRLGSCVPAHYGRRKMKHRNGQSEPCLLLQVVTLRKERTVTTFDSNSHVQQTRNDVSVHC